LEDPRRNTVSHDLFAGIASRLPGANGSNPCKKAKSVQKVEGRKSINNREIYIIIILFTLLHPHPHARVRAYARDGAQKAQKVMGGFSSPVLSRLVSQDIPGSGIIDRSALRELTGSSALSRSLTIDRSGDRALVRVSACSRFQSIRRFRHPGVGRGIIILTESHFRRFRVSGIDRAAGIFPVPAFSQFSRPVIAPCFSIFTVRSISQVSASTDRPIAQDVPGSSPFDRSPSMPPWRTLFSARLSPYSSVNSVC
jgi:hypothetical protein